MRRAFSMVALALALALTGCTGGGERPNVPQLPGGGPKVVVSEDRAPSVTTADGSVRIDQVVRSGQNVAVAATIATAGRSNRLGRFSSDLTTNTGRKLELDKADDREMPPFSVATLTVQATLPDEGVTELRLTTARDLTVAIPLPAEDGATVWRPAPLRQVGLAQEPRQTSRARIVFDTVRSDGLVTEVTYHATVPDNERLDVCSYNFQDDKCRLVEPDGTVHPLLGRTEQAASNGGRAQGTLRFLGELDPANTRLTLYVSAATSGKDLDPIDVTLPTHADSPTQAAAGDLTRDPSTLATPVTATATDRGASITVTRVDVLADRVQLTARLTAGHDLTLR